MSVLHFKRPLLHIARHCRSRPSDEDKDYENFTISPLLCLLYFLFLSLYPVYLLSIFSSTLQ